MFVIKFRYRTTLRYASDDLGWPLKKSQGHIIICFLLWVSWCIWSILYAYIIIFLTIWMFLKLTGHAFKVTLRCQGQNLTHQVHGCLVTWQIYIACLTLHATIRWIAGEEFANIWKNRALSDKFGQCVFKIYRKQNGRDLWWPLEVKFKMATKTTIKTNKCNISARFWSRIICNTLFSMFYGIAILFPGSF